MAVTTLDPRSAEFLADPRFEKVGFSDTYQDRDFGYTFNGYLLEITRELLTKGDNSGNQSITFFHRAAGSLQAQKSVNIAPYACQDIAVLKNYSTYRQNVVKPETGSIVRNFPGVTGLREKSSVELVNLYEIPGEEGVCASFLIYNNDGIKNPKIVYSGSNSLLTKEGGLILNIWVVKSIMYSISPAFLELSEAGIVYELSRHMFRYFGLELLPFGQMNILIENADGTLEKVRLSHDATSSVLMHFTHNSYSLTTGSSAVTAQSSCLKFMQIEQFGSPEAFGGLAVLPEDREFFSQNPRLKIFRDYLTASQGTRTWGEPSISKTIQKFNRKLKLRSDNLDTLENFGKFIKEHIEYKAKNHTKIIMEKEWGKTYSVLPVEEKRKLMFRTKAAEFLGVA